MYISNLHTKIHILPYSLNPTNERSHTRGGLNIKGNMFARRVYNSKDFHLIKEIVWDVH